MPSRGVELALTRKWAWCAAIALAGMNVVMLAGTWWFDHFMANQRQGWRGAPEIKHLYVQLSLCVENVVASWYSSMLLASVAGMSLLCWLRDRQESQRRPGLLGGRILQWGWMLLAAVFLGLSADEMGSIHERIGRLFPVVQDGMTMGWSYSLLPPILACILLLACFAVGHLYRQPGVLLLMLLGLACYATVPLQEQFEQQLWRNAQFSDAWRRPVMHLLIEEGSELLGGLCFFTATALFATRVGMPLRVPLQMSTRQLRVVGAGASGLCLISLAGGYLLTRSINFPQSGVVLNWPPSVLAFVLALAMVVVSRDSNSRRLRARWVGGAACLLGVSVYYGANVQSYPMSFHSNILLRSGQCALAIAVMGTALFSAALAQNPTRKCAIRTAGVAIVITLFKSGPWLSVAAASLLLAWLLHLLHTFAAAPHPEVANMLDGQVDEQLEARASDFLR